MRALVLFAHGARDPRWAEPFQRVRDAVAAKRPGVRVELAFLELMTPDLDTVADALAADGFAAMNIVPIFLGQGSHLRRDLPLLIDAVRARHSGLKVTLAGAAGEDADVIDALADYCLRITT
jgi:sirohydrochlorin cobaltochelatase